MNFSKFFTLTLSTTLLLSPGYVQLRADTLTDYEKDKTKTFVHEQSSDALDQVNSILCMFEQTKYSDPSLLNTGYYSALVDQSVCEGRDSTENSSDSSSGGTSASGAKEYTTFKVKSERAKATDPQTVSAFVKIKGPNDAPLSVQAKLVITEGASSFNPLGAFTLSYGGFVAGVPIPPMKGIIKSVRDTQGRVLIKFAEEIGIPGGATIEAVKAALVRNTEGGSGSVYQLEQQGGPGAGTPKTNHFTYNPTKFLGKDASANEQRCLSRTSYETSAWSYGVYNQANGSRVTVNSGFPINTRADGRGSFGFLGYYGLSLPPGAATINNGDTVYRIERSGGGQPSATPYTILVKNGKLKRHTRSETTLGALRNLPLEGMVPIVGASDAFTSMKRLTWDGSTLSIVAAATQGNGGPPSWANVTPQPITSSTNLLFGDLGLFSQALGGEVRIKLSCTAVNNTNPALGVTCTAPSASTPVVFFAESTVSPTDATVPGTLRCYDNCPKAGVSGIDKNDTSYPNDGTAHNYTFTAGILQDGGNPATLSEAPNGQPWGLNSGLLYNPTPANNTLLECPWNAAQVCSWQGYSVLSEFYTWETGPNTWNKFTSVQDSNNNVVQFDAPISVKFTYPTAGTGGLNPSAVDQKFAGNTFYLQYGGFGNLSGIPGKCFNPANPSDNDPDCSKRGRRWVPEFTIPAGTAATNSNGSITYLIKPLEIEQRMAKLALAQCSALKISDLSSQWLNLSKDWTDPNLGVEPDITDAPRVIGGVVQ